MAPVHRSNLSQTEWSDVWLDEVTLKAIAAQLTNGEFLPWTETLLQLTTDAKTVLDLGSGRGEHSAILARNGRQPTLVDWSRQNLDFSAQLFEDLGLRGDFVEADITEALPFEADSFDAVFCCGVLEFLPDATIRAVLREALRVSRKRVIVMVPNALSLPYRIGKWHMERTRTWVWKGELPFYTLKPYFASSDDLRVSEFSVAAKHSLKFLQMPMGLRIAKTFTRLFKLEDHAQHAPLRQGYLLVTVGEKTRNDSRKLPRS
jgi:ubiquinone/menaquinone biosynthesis C-methylase UbiE